MLGGARRSSRRSSSCRSGRATRTRATAARGAGSLIGALDRGRSRRSRSCCSTPRPWHAATVFFHHTFGYQFGRSSPFSLWDWRPVPREGAARPPLGPARPPGGARRRRARPLPLAAPPLAAADGRVHRRAARRVRDGADPLVVALPRVVLPVRRLRAARPRAAEEPVAVAQDEPFAGDLVPAV